MFLPEDIEGAVFSRTLGGYSPREVDEYLAELKEKFEEICSENADLRAEVENLRMMLAENAATAAAVTVPDEEPETVEEPEVVEEPEIIEEPEAVEEPEEIEEPEAVEGSEAIEESDEDEDPETIQIPLMPDDEYGEDEIASVVKETPDEAEEAEEAAEEAEAEAAEEKAEAEEFVFETESADENAPQEDASPAGEGDIKFEDLEEALLKVYGDWRTPEDTEAEKADPAIFRDAWDGADEDGADEEPEEDEGTETDEEIGVDAETDADEDAAPADVQHEDTPAQVTSYRKRIYHIRKKSAQPSDADDDADFALHNYDEYNYFFGDGKK